VQDTELSTGEAAARLDVSAPTVRSLLRAGELSGRTVERGGRFAWRISESSVDSYIRDRGRREGNRSRTTVAKLSAQLDELRREVRSLAAPAGQYVEADLRSEIATLRAAVMQQRAIADASNAADRTRAEVVQHLLAALAASETADERRREALAAAETIVGQFVTPGDPRDVSNPNPRAEPAPRTQP
jgi:excisionase family DNA binding protein